MGNQNRKLILGGLGLALLGKCPVSLPAWNMSCGWGLKAVLVSQWTPGQDSADVSHGDSKTPFWVHPSKLDNMEDAGARKAVSAPTEAQSSGGLV